MNNSKVICFGEALVDRLGALGGIPSIDRTFHDCLGGAPANVACGLARLGIDVGFIGCVGNDSIGLQFKDLFLARGVNIKGLQVNQAVPTRIVLVQRDSDGERTFGGFLGGPMNVFADQALDLSKLKKVWLELISDASWLVMGTIPLAFEGTREIAIWTIDQAVKNGIKIAIDLNWRPTFWDPSAPPNSLPSKEVSSLIRSTLDSASLLKLSKEEALWFFNSEDPVEIAESLRERPNVIITDGSNPIKWILYGFVGMTSALSPKIVVDTTGAGDSFMAGIMSQVLSFSKPNSLSEANSMIEFSAACGAFVCKAAGAIAPQPNYSEIEEFLLSAL